MPAEKSETSFTNLPTRRHWDIVREREEVKGGRKMAFIRPPWATSLYLSAKHSQEEEKREKQPLPLFHSPARSPPKCWLSYSHFVSDIQLHNTQKSTCSRKSEKKRTNRLNWKAPVILWLKSFHELWCNFKKALWKQINYLAIIIFSEIMQQFWWNSWWGI